ncbi:50S ribosomal protein L24p [Candidatus Mancarchaeum acidiphilum]|uniref:50S ribosomal protein L24 n=1 Tax=Candidatus Mancarchaeum acidiphilum TaxID=1920749 RepID=A0A218NLS4_9ARCH|nr:50S ribosomal protein L24 [Candidatus Mancarchaeum acidiphilum]ASI13411.1 50S ribosomal protein L24p [Candidatus Mancarchaeum acidiphilum]
MGMLKSSQPRKQIKFRHEAPMHLKQHFVHANLNKSAREKYKLNKRAVQICKGDTVKIMTGSHKGTTGKVTVVNTKRQFIYLDSLKRKNAKGKEMNIPVTASNVSIIELNLSDKYRASKLKLKQVIAPKAEPVKKELPSSSETANNEKSESKESHSTEVQNKEPESEESESSAIADKNEV